MVGMRFFLSDLITHTAQAAYNEHARRIHERLPNVEVRHVGGSSVPGLLTSGDVDLQVRVAPTAAVSAGLLPAPSGLHESRRAGRLCRAAAARHGSCGRSRARSRRERPNFGPSQRRSDLRLRSPRGVRLGRVALQSGSPRHSRERSLAPSAERSTRPSAQRQPRARADRDGYQHRRRNPVRLQAFRPILRS